MNAGLVIGIIAVLVGAGPLVFGLVTGAMPPPSTNLWIWSLGPDYRDERPWFFWVDGAMWAALALFGCYQIFKSW
jgi:hypothetical protein